MDTVKEKFLTNLSTQGFAIEETDYGFTLRPRGVQEDRSISITLAGKQAMWTVTGRSGAYRAFGRGNQRTYFEDTINRLWIQAQLAQ